MDIIQTNKKLLLLSFVSLLSIPLSLASEKPIFAWTFFGPDSSVGVRATTSGTTCPKLTVDSQTIQMKARPSAPNVQFPILVCEAEISSKAKEIQVDGESVPAPNLNPKKIVILGDTGCVIKQVKDKARVQACNDPDKWPFAQVALSAANWKPDLVIHVGDYHYRERSCPDQDLRCKGAISGDQWDSWEQDFFGPASPLLKAAPWILARGNHELCSRAGEGWFRLLEPRESPEKCSDERDPYRLKLDGFSLWVIDSASDHNIQNNLIQVSKLLQTGEWLLLHRPFLTPGVAKTVPSLPEAMSGAGKIGVVMAGHKHLLSINQFSDSRPPELITGNGGTQLAKVKGESTRPFKSDDGKVNSLTFVDFGFATMEARGNSWIYSARDKMGKEIFQCNFKQEKDQKTILLCNSDGL